MLPNNCVYVLFHLDIMFEFHFVILVFIMFMSFFFFFEGIMFMSFIMLISVIRTFVKDSKVKKIVKFFAEKIRLLK